VPDAGTITRFASMTRRQAAASSAVLLLVTAWLLAGARGPRPPSDAPSGAVESSTGGDVELYRSVVARVRRGESYYAAAAAELRARHYPLRPALNFRQPTYAWLLARLPHPLVGSAILALVAACVVILTRRWLRTTALAARVLPATAVVTLSVAGCLVPDYVFLQEAWAGLFIALSVSLFAVERWRAGVAACFVALAFRELALVACGVGLALALRRRRWPEVAAWLVGLATYAALMAWHVAEASRHLRPDDMARGWLALGGSRFILATCQWNGLLVALPLWAVALVVPVILLGLTGWRDATATRVALVVVGYLVAFAFVGNPFNDYWGAMFAPLLGYGLLPAADAVRELAGALRGRAIATTASPSGTSASGAGERPVRPT
jgi:hypothetical protein